MMQMYRYVYTVYLLHYLTELQAKTTIHKNTCDYDALDDNLELVGTTHGRMYDYNNGRFLSVDPFISNPASTQALNPYTYIFNNPLSGTDPTGYRPSVGFGGQSVKSVCVDGNCLGSPFLTKSELQAKKDRKNNGVQSGSNSDDDKKAPSEKGDQKNKGFGSFVYGIVKTAVKETLHSAHTYITRVPREVQGDPTGLSPNNATEAAGAQEYYDNQLVYDVGLGVLSYSTTKKAYETVKKLTTTRNASSSGSSVATKIAVKYRDSITLLQNQKPNSPFNALQQNALFKGGGGKWYTRSPSGNVWTAQGKYDFVVTKNGGIFVTKKGTLELSGHLGLSRGAGVRYAGEIQFSGRTNAGRLKYWDNNSGHYLPDASLNHQAGLPLNKFQIYND